MAKKIIIALAAIVGVFVAGCLAYDFCGHR